MLQFPTTEQVLDGFSSAGFWLEEVQRVPQKTERVRLRVDSAMSLLPDAEFEQCHAALGRTARDQPPEPAIEIIELLVLKAA